MGFSHYFTLFARQLWQTISICEEVEITATDISDFLLFSFLTHDLRWCCSNSTLIGGSEAGKLLGLALSFSHFWRCVSSKVNQSCWSPWNDWETCLSLLWLRLSHWFSIHFREFFCCLKMSFLQKFSYCLDSERRTTLPFFWKTLTDLQTQSKRLSAWFYLYLLLAYHLSFTICSIHIS